MRCPHCNCQIKLLSVKDFADIVGVHRRTIENRIKAGEIECFDTTIGRLIPANLVDTFKKKRGAKQQEMEHNGKVKS